MMGKAHGATMENFPDLPGAVFNDGQTIDQLRQHYGDFYARPGFQSWTVLYVTETIDLTSAVTTSFASTARIASMIWLVPWTRLASSGATPPIVFVDPQRDTFAPSAGHPIGAIKFSSVAGVRTFSRQFQGGTANMEINALNTIITSTWVAD